MGVMASKMGPTAGMVPPRETRRWSLFGKLSVLLSGASDHAARTQDGTHASMDLQALRQRMTPDGPVQSVPAAIRTKHGEDELPPMQAPGDKTGDDRFSRYAVPWSDECVEQEWKPVLLSDGAVAPAIPSLDDLAEEAGIDPSAMRFPIDS